MNKLVKIFSITAVAFALQGCISNKSGHSATTPSLTKQQPPAVQLAIEQYQLPNGLRVVLHQDKSDPIVASAIVYHVGSNREKLGRTGFAHFFEHMLFQDSEHVGAGNFIKNIGNMGGTLNGGTWQDGTIYYEVFPKDGLEKVLWMESDRMGYFINTVTQAGLENEKQVVKNEKRQSVDNRPYGHTDYVTLQALYPKGHPYSWDVIGSLEDLQNATLQDVRDFYQQWYGVNNATLVLAGDFDSQQAKAWITKYFAELTPRGDVTPLPPMPTRLKHSKSFYHEDNFAKLPELTLTYPTVPMYQKEAYALQLLADLLSDGKDSLLYQTVVEHDKLAPTVSARSDNAEIAGTFQIKVRAFGDQDLDAVKASIDQALAKFAEQGFSDQQLARIMTRRETAFYNGLTSVFDKAAALAQHSEFGGDPKLVATEIEQFRAITRDDIMGVFKRYLQGKPYVATSFVPKGSVELALADAQKADVVEEKIVQGAEQQPANQAQTSALEPLAETLSAIDRNINPPYGDKPVIKLPAVWQNTLANGIKVLSIEQTELPLVSFSIRILGGHLLDQPGKAGSANLLTKMMMEGTADKTPQQFETALGELGAELSFDADHEFITLSASTLASNFPAVMALAQSAVKTTLGRKRMVAGSNKKPLAEIVQSSANPGAIAQNVYAKLMYDNDSMLSSAVTGTQDQVNQITLADLKAYYQTNMVANLANIHVAGQISQAQVMAAVQPFATQWKQGQVTLPSQFAAKAIDKAQLYFVDVPGAKQSFIRIGQPAMVANSADYYPAVAVNHNLGGSFSGQLFQILRLQRGYTYGAYSNISHSNGGGLFTASSSVGSNVTLESLQTFRQIMFDYLRNFDQAALESTQSVLAKADARAFETTKNLMGVLQNIGSYHLSDDYVAKQQAALSTMTLAQAQSILTKYINPDAMVYLVVGDAATQLPRLKDLGLGEPTLLDVNGDPVH